MIHRQLRLSFKVMDSSGDLQLSKAEFAAGIALSPCLLHVSVTCLMPEMCCVRELPVVEVQGVPL